MISRFDLVLTIQIFVEISKDEKENRHNFLVENNLYFSNICDSTMAK